MGHLKCSTINFFFFSHYFELSFLSLAIKRDLTKKTIKITLGKSKQTKQNTLKLIFKFFGLLQIRKDTTPQTVQIR